MIGTLITVAGTGGEISKAEVPHLPASPDEIAEMASGCEAAGAAMIHIHVRDEAGLPTLDLARINETVAAVRERSNMVIQLSTGGAITDPFDARLRVLEAKPESCSLTLGTVNFGDGVFSNPWGLIVDLFRESKLQRVVPEFEIFELGHLATLRRLIDQEGLPFGGNVHCDLVLGVPGAAPGLPRIVQAAVDMFPDEVTSWSATGIGRAALPVALTALALGGNLRVGMEDTLTFAAKRPVRGNAELVERAVQLARIAQRPPLSPDEARSLLSIRES